MRMKIFDKFKLFEDRKYIDNSIRLVLKDASSLTTPEKAHLVEWFADKLDLKLVVKGEVRIIKKSEDSQ